MLIHPNNPRAILILSSVAVLLLLGGMWFLIQRGDARDSTTTTDGVTYTGEGSVMVEEDTNTAQTNTETSDFMRPLVFKADLSGEVESVLEAQFREVREILAETPDDFNALSSLGLVRKIAGDYTEAARVWEYVSRIYPNNAVTFSGLGDLYLNFIKNYAKAEVAYKQAIKIAPNSTDAYRNLFALYTDYGYDAGATAAEDILKEGIIKNPNAIDLHVLLARYYTGKGENENARAEYGAALKAAKGTGNTILVSQIQTELDTLPPR